MYVLKAENRRKKHIQKPSSSHLSRQHKSESKQTNQKKTTNQAQQQWPSDHPRRVISASCWSIVSASSTICTLHFEHCIYLFAIHIFYASITLLYKYIHCTFTHFMYCDTQCVYCRLNYAIAYCQRNILRHPVVIYNPLILHYCTIPLLHLLHCRIACWHCTVPMPRCSDLLPSCSLLFTNI